EHNRPVLFRKGLHFRICPPQLARYLGSAAPTRPFQEVCMSSLSVPYALGGTLTEQQRLIAQAQRVELHAGWLLDRIGIQPGAESVDFGCGPIGILNLLSERVGPAGVVVGVEREPRFAAMARTEISKRGLQNVEIAIADALKTGLERKSYDFVHERLI